MEFYQDELFLGVGQIAVCFLVVDGCFFHRIEDYACFSCRCCVCALVDEKRVSINGRNDPKRLRLLAFDAWVKNNETREKTKKSAEDESLIMVSVNMNTFDNDNAGLWSLTSTSFCLFVTSLSHHGTSRSFTRQSHHSRLGFRWGRTTVHNHGIHSATTAGISVPRNSFQ